MRPVRRLALIVAVVAGVAGCGGGGTAAMPRGRVQPGSEVVSVGRPTTPRRVRVQRGGTLELIAPAVGSPPSPGFRLAVLRARGADPRDLCVATVPVGLRWGEANGSCDVRAPGAVAVFVGKPGVPDRLGPPPTVVAGIAPGDIVRVALSGPGGRGVLPLSRHRAFLALYAAGVRGRLRLTAYRADGSRMLRSFSLPLSRHANLFPGHPHRRRGAVFGDEVGKNILARSYASIVRRFGPPAARERDHGQRCIYYEVVGDGPIGWRFCFAADGRMTGAIGYQRLPT